MKQSLCHHGVSHRNQLPASNYTQPIRTKHKSSVSSNSVRVIPPKKKSNKRNHQRKMTDARTLHFTNLHPVFFPSFFFFNRYRKSVRGRRGGV